MHGIGCSKDNWSAIIMNISAKYHCVAVDMPGHGESTFIEGFDRPTFKSYRDSVQEFLEIIGLAEHKIYLIVYNFL